jgi:ATP-dependent exoDNAse (exonuclease V) alpha subunit
MVRDKLAQVKYNYAITAHKSQGSTYENVIVIEPDIDANSKIVERNRIKYVAYTRAKSLLFIVK